MRTRDVGDGLEGGPAALVSLLRGPALRCRTGILLLPPHQLGREPDVAARLGIGHVDYAETLRRTLPTGATFVDLSADTEETRLDELATGAASRKDEGGGADCLLVFNFDLALAKLEPPERARLWGNLRDRFPHRRRALLLALPERATHLLPIGDDRTVWEDAQRLAVFA